MRRYTSAARMPLGKWFLCLIFGLVIFYGFYYLSLLAGAAVPGIWWLRALVYAACGMAGIIFYAAWANITERRTVSELPVKRLVPATAGGFLLGILFFGSVIGVMALSGVFSITEAHFFGADFVPYLMYFFVVAVYEEIIFRGILFRLFDDRWNTLSALLVSALVFGAVHLFNPGATLWSAAAIAVEAGLLLGVAFKCSGNLWLPIGLHWAWNFVEGPVLGFAVSGIAPKYHIFSTILSGPDWLTGGVFGAEAAVPTVVLGLLLTVLLLLFSKRERR